MFEFCFLVYPPSHPLRLDIAFAVGGYGPDADAIFGKQKEFINTFLNSYQYPISYGQIGVAFISYGDSVTVVKNLRENFDVQTMKSLVNGIRLVKREPTLGTVFSVAAKSVFSQSVSDGRRKVLLLFTDFTSSQDWDRVKKAIDLLRLQGVTVIALGAGNKVSIPNLVGMTTSSRDAIIAESSKTMMYYFYDVYLRILECK